MNNANIVIMGKTGSGKSTIVNAVMVADVAPTGVGRPITKKNQVYSRKMLLTPNPNANCRQVSCAINLFDTVGLELDRSITQKTLFEIRGYIEKAQSNDAEMNQNLVWFCVNNKSSRFESYEVELIKDLANSYEIPFVIVITQCFSNEKGELEKQIEDDFPEVSIMRVLAKDYKARVGVFPAFGIDELLCHSVFSYNKLKVGILESKLEQLLGHRDERIALLREKANTCIQKHAQSAQNIGWIPGGCVPIVHGICMKMLYDLDGTVGIHTVKGFGAYIFSNIMIGIIATPFMVVPLLSVAVARGYVEAVGESYRDALLTVIEKSTDRELANIDLVSTRIKEELHKRS